MVADPTRGDVTERPPAVLRPLFDALRLVAVGDPLDGLQRALMSIDLDADALGDLIAIDTAAYVRTLVLRRPTIEVFVMAWLPGQRSPIHDHRGSACAVKVVSGVGLEQLYTPGPEQTAIRSGGAQRVAKGGVIGSFDNDIHSFGNAAASPASIRDILVTIHAYWPPLAPTAKYVEGEYPAAR
ncbi:MAG TPA: cysteine dioxygenase family protein [Nannocystaceae bacterium]|nr:cysteine dioxygenase family protein [Nannocystaceae bacterium]